MPITKSTSRVVYVRVDGALKSQIKKDANDQRRTEAEVVRHILKLHYAEREATE